MENAIWFEIVKIIFMALGVLVVIFQINLDHNRRRKQSTIDFWNLISGECNEFYNYIKDKTLDLSIVNSDPKLDECVREYLARLERLAVGVNYRIYDFKILNLICGQHLLWEYKRFENYINGRREKEHYPYYYKAFEFLVERIKIYKRKHPKEKDTGGTLYL